MAAPVPGAIAARAAEFDDLLGLPEEQEETEPEGLWDAYISGVAIINLHGETVQRHSWMDAWSGLTSYEELRAKLVSALEHEQVRAVLINVDSPGGMVAGCFDFAEWLYQKRGDKPIWAVSDEACFSAAYAIASACDRVFLTRTAGVGSIGACMAHMNYSRALDKAGLDYYLIKSGKRKQDFNPFTPMEKEALAQAQAEIDRLGGIFAEMVDRNRSLKPGSAGATQAGLYFGPDAVAEGLADEVSPANEVLAKLIEKVNQGGAETNAPTQNQAKGANMPDKTKKAEEAPPVNAAASAAGDDAKPEVKPQAATPDADGAAKAERERIAAIIGSKEAEGRKGLAEHLAFKTSMSAEEARGILAEAPQVLETELSVTEAENPFMLAMAKETGPEIGTGGGDVYADQSENPDLMASLMASKFGPRKGGE
jgi:ClpP class serine protease